MALICDSSELVAVSGCRPFLSGNTTDEGWSINIHPPDNFGIAFAKEFRSDKARRKFLLLVDGCRLCGLPRRSSAKATQCIEGRRHQSFPASLGSNSCMESRRPRRNPQLSHRGECQKCTLQCKR